MHERCQEVACLRGARPGSLGDPIAPAQGHGLQGSGPSSLWCPRSGRANHQDPVTPPNLPGGKPGSGPPPGRPFQQQVDMGEPAWGRCPANPDRREILREYRAAREPRSDPAAVSLPRRHRCQRATAAAPRADIGAAAARRRDRDRSRTGRRPDRRDHHRRNRTSPCCPVLPRRRVRPGGRLPSRRPGLADRPADARQGHLRRLPARPRAPVPGGGRRRSGRLRRSPETAARPRRTSPSRASPPAAGSPSPPWSTPAITGCPCPPRPSSCHRTPT